MTLKCMFVYFVCVDMDPPGSEIKNYYYVCIYIISLMFFFMTTNKKQQCYPLYFI